MNPCTVQIFSKSPIETRSFPIGRCSAECWLLYLRYFQQLLERYWSIVRAVKVFHWEWLSDCCYVGLLQLGQCWFAIRALLQLLTPLQSPLLAVLLESLGILLFIFLVYKPLSNGYIVRSRQRRFLF